MTLFMLDFIQEYICNKLNIIYNTDFLSVLETHRITSVFCVVDFFGDIFLSLVIETKLNISMYDRSE